jgi:hypothetical protein
VTRWRPGLSPSDGVALLTPAGAAGREWRYVAVAGVQEGVWPDLRLRGSLLGSEELVDVVTGRDRTFRAAQTAVRYDETRLFLVATSRATERLLVTAVRSEDDQPSVYLDLVDPLVGAGASANHLPPEQREFTELGTHSCAALTGRRPSPPTRPGRRPTGAGAAASALARMAAAGVDGADPQQWWVQRVLSDDRPLRRPAAAGPPLTVQGRELRRLPAALGPDQRRGRRTEPGVGQSRHAHP